jgi:tricorn protease
MLAAPLAFSFAIAAFGGETKLLRHPHATADNIVFSYMGDLWTVNQKGENLQRLTAHAGRDFAPRYSPDGQWIAFSSDRSGNADVWLVSAKGGIPKQLTVHPADETVLGWTPDGQKILFASQRGEDFMGKLYLVSVNGGAPENAGPDMGVYASYSPDGAKLALNRKSQSYWRPGYHGSYQSDITIMDVNSKTFADITNYDGIDSWPMFGTDGYVYFVSDRDGMNKFNLWRVKAEGGEAERVSNFESGEIRFPAMATDGKSIVFEHDFGLWRIDLASRESTPIVVAIAAEPQADRMERREFNSQVDDFALVPDGRRIIFSIRGEIFTAPTSEGEITRVTKSPARDQNVDVSPDGKWITFATDEPGNREELYIAPVDGSAPPKRLTDVDALKSSYVFSPDSKKIAFTASDGKLYTIGVDGDGQKELVASKYGSINGFDWSPDGSLIAFSKSDETRTSDVFIIPSEGGEAKKVTFDPSNDVSPRFSADGKKLYFVRTDLSVDTFGGGDRPSSQIYMVFLEKQEKDPDEVAENANNADDNGREAMMRRFAEGRGGPAGPGATPGAGGPGQNNPGRPGAAPAAPPKAPNIDWAGLKRRTRQVTRSTGMIASYIPSHDSHSLLYVGMEGGGLGGLGGRAGGMGGSPTIYLISDDGKRSARVAAGSAPTPTEGEDGPARGFRGGFGGGIRNLSLTRDGRSVYYQQGDGVYSATVPPLPAANATSGGATGLAAMLGGRRGPGAPGQAPTPATLGAADAAGGAASGRRVNFNVRVEIDQPAEWLEMFDDAWLCMKNRFYDTKMHGIDWNAMRERYRPLVAHVGTKAELIDLINEMIGELNASHTGAAAGRDRTSADGQPSSSPFRDAVSLGFELEPDTASGRYKVSHVFEDGPADKEWIKVRVGDYLLKLDGREIKVGDDLVAILADRLNAKVKITLNDKPEAEGAWTLKLDPVGRSAYASLRYEKWVKDRRAMVDKLSDGRVGYLHIKAMDQPSLARFRKELGENRAKEALVIDQRFNGGGNIEQELLAILVQRPYQVWQPRGTEPTQRPFAGFFGPKVVLQNWRSASNAEMFPAGFRALGLGKVIGTPTMGAVIGTGSYSLIDGSTVRTPGVGVYLADQVRTNMENTPVQPDIAIENTPEDNLAGRDRQIEAAVKTLLEQLPNRQGATVGGGNNE